MQVAWVRQMPQAWHDQGLHIGMHWAWWLFWIVAIVLVAWALVRLGADQSEARRNAARIRRAEAELRRRYESGELDRDALIRELTALIVMGEPRP